MKISVIIPVYNVAEYLRACVDSVLQNDCADCEILLVDDGSTDGICPGLCDAIAAERPELVRVIHQENRGLGGARNRGLEEARGEYVFFPDSDDTIAPETLSLLKKAAEDTGADVIAFDFCTVTPAGEMTPQKPGFALPEGAFSLDGCPEMLTFSPSAWTKLWRRSLFTDHGIRFPERVWYEDIRTSPKLYAVAEKIVYLPVVLYHYLLRPGSIMNNAKLERNREIMDAFDDLLGWFSARGIADLYRRQLCALTVEHVLLAASVRVAREDARHPLLSEFAAYTKAHFPDLKKTYDRAALPAGKRLALALTESGHYRLLSLLFRIRSGR